MRIISIEGKIGDRYQICPLETGTGGMEPGIRMRKSKRPTPKGRPFAAILLKKELCLNGRFAKGALPILLKSHRRGPVGDMGKLGVGQIEKQHHDRHQMAEVDDVAQ